MSIKDTLPENKINQAKTRLLLALFVAEEPVMKGKLTDKVKPSKEKAADYQSVFDELLEIGAIEKSDKGYSLVRSVGLKILDESLKNTDFENNTIGTWVVNALLKLIRENESKTNSLAELQNQTQIEEFANEAIASYDKFKEITLEVYEELNRNYNLDNLVPIYRIRKEIGEKVSRENFNQWILEMQKKDILQLIGGEMTDITPEKAEDSITTKLSGLRYYAKRIG